MNIIDDKAKELVEKYEEVFTFMFIHKKPSVKRKYAKQCALICVDEKIITLTMVKELYGAAIKAVWKKEDEMAEAFRYWCDNSISDLEKVKEKIQSL